MTHKFTQSTDGYVVVSQFATLPCPICEKKLIFHKSWRKMTCEACGCTHDIYPPPSTETPQPAGDPVLGDLEFHPSSETPPPDRLCVLRIYGGPANDAPIIRPGWFMDGSWYWTLLESAGEEPFRQRHQDFEWALWPELLPDPKP